MKRLPFIILLILLAAASASGYKLKYKENLYKLYTQRFYSYPENISEGIYFLEQALRADFANPLNALAVIRTPEEWEHYRNLFMMHLNLKLTELYLQMGSKYDRQAAYFFNYPWKEDNLKSLEIAEKWYRYALNYWNEAVTWAEKIRPFRFNLEEIQNWEDEEYRIRTGELDYEDIIDEHLNRLEGVRRIFEDMDTDTY